MTKTTNAEATRRVLQVSLETARAAKELLESRQSKLVDRYLASKQKDTTGTFTLKNRTLNGQIAGLREEITRCRESLDDLPFS